MIRQKSITLTLVTTLPNYGKILKTGFSSGLSWMLQRFSQPTDFHSIFPIIISSNYLGYLDQAN